MRRARATDTHDDTEAICSLTKIEGVGPALAGLLREAGVHSPTALLSAGATESGRLRLAEVTGVDLAQITRFVNRADLMRIRGVGGEYAELLAAAGAETVEELATRNPTNLSARTEMANDERKLVRLVPAASRVADWVQQARRLDRVVLH